MTMHAAPMGSRDLLGLAARAYAGRCQRIAGALSDGPDLAPSFEGTCGRAVFEARLSAEPFTLPAEAAQALTAAIDALRQSCPLEEDLDRLEQFRHRVLTLLERRREPYRQQLGGRRWLDRAPALAAQSRLEPQCMPQQRNEIAART